MYLLKNFNSHSTNMLLLGTSIDRVLKFSWIFLMGIIILFLSSCGYKEYEPHSPPNIIFLLTDDQRWDAIGCMGNSNILTPEMDKLAAAGVKFTNAFVTTPICAISRASILSGQYARKHGIIDFSTHFADSAYQLTYPMQLKKAGYRIGFIGKYGVGLEKDFPEVVIDISKSIVANTGGYEQTKAAVTTAFSAIQKALDNNVLSLSDTEKEWMTKMETAISSFGATEGEAIEHLQMMYGDVFKLEAYGL